MKNAWLRGGARTIALAWMVVVVVVTAAAPMGCAGEGDLYTSADDDVVGEDGAPRRQTSNRQTSNSLFAQSLQANRVASLPFGANIETRPLAATPLGDELLRYMARCMLPAGKNVAIRDANGLWHVYAGLLALAPAWTERALTTSEQKWMYACLLTHINAFGLQIPLSVRGPHVALRPLAASEAQQFAYEEGAFWVTAATGEWYACYGKATLKQCGQALASASIQWRVCSTAMGGVNCGRIRSVGPCRDFTGAGQAACERRGPDGAYEACHDRLGTSGVWPTGSPATTEVMTSYVEQLDDISCSPYGP